MRTPSLEQEVSATTDLPDHYRATVDAAGNHCLHEFPYRE
jgi:hypothetical protein